MILIKLAVLEIVVFLNVWGIPVGNSDSDCQQFWLNIMGSPYSGGNCKEDVELLSALENSIKVSRQRLTKRDDSSFLSSVLSSVGSIIKSIYSNSNLNMNANNNFCGSCEIGVSLLKYYLSRNDSMESLIQKAIHFCKIFKFMSDETCTGIVEINGPSMFYILRNTKLSPSEICGYITNRNCTGTVNSDHVWHIDVPEIEDEQKEKLLLKNNKINEEAPKLKVLHISDTHFDPHYMEGTWADCSEPLCCREDSREPELSASLSGRWGGWKCDLPERTLDNLFEHISKQHPDIDYVIWTGDLPPHDFWSLHRDESLSILSKTVAKMKKYFPGIPVYPSLGNHETVPPNMFPTSEVPIGAFNVDWLYEQTEKEWSYWLGTNSSETLRKGAFYTIKNRQGLRIVSLNTNYCYKSNWWLMLNSTDPMQQLKWLVDVLQEAENNEEKVHIIGHVPTGHEDCLGIWKENYYNIIKRFKNTVTAQFFGHTHMDEFELFYDKENLKEPFGVAYVGPSATTFTYLNPGYRIYYVDGDHSETTRYVVDHETWIMDLETSNERGTPEWYKLYSAKEAYNMTSLTPQDWHNFFHNLFEDDQLLDLYYKHYWKASPRRLACEAGCREKIFCGIRSCDQYGYPIVITLQEVV